MTFGVSSMAFLRALVSGAEKAFLPRNVFVEQKPEEPIP